MRTTPVIGNLVRKVYEVILTEFILTVTGGTIIRENERKLLSLAPLLGLHTRIGYTNIRRIMRNRLSKFHHDIRTSLQSHYLEDINQILN